MYGKKTCLFRNLRKSKDLNNLEVVAVTETWLHDDYFDCEISSSSLYTIYRKDRGGNKRGGGTVLLAVKTDLLAYRRPDLEPQNSEILVCDLVFDYVSFRSCTKPLRNVACVADALNLLYIASAN